MGWKICPDQNGSFVELKASFFFSSLFCIFCLILFSDLASAASSFSLFLLK